MSRFSFTARFWPRFHNIGENKCSVGAFPNENHFPPIAQVCICISWISPLRPCACSCTCVLDSREAATSVDFATVSRRGQTLCLSLPVNSFFLCFTRLLISFLVPPLRRVLSNFRHLFSSFGPSTRPWFLFLLPRPSQPPVSSLPPPSANLFSSSSPLSCLPFYPTGRLPGPIVSPSLPSHPPLPHLHSVPSLTQLNVGRDTARGE